VTGTWIGASPETLLIKKGDSLISMALAGTRPAGTNGEWDKKNIEEQRIVSCFISDKLIENGFMPHPGNTHTYTAGPVEHIRTVFTARDAVSDKDACLHKALKTAFDLSPTPALAGYPRPESMKAIKAYEDFERGYYGGFCGPVTAGGDFSFFVNLRSARIQPEISKDSSRPAVCVRRRRDHERFRSNVGMGRDRKKSADMPRKNTDRQQIQ